MSLTLKQAMMAALLSLPIIMVALLGYLSYTNAILIVRDLGGQVVEQTTSSIKNEVNTLIDDADKLSKSNKNFVEIEKPNYDKLAQRFRRQLDQFKDFSYLSFTSPNGDYMHVWRRSDNQLEYQSLVEGRKARFVWTNDGWVSNAETEVAVDKPLMRPHYISAIEAKERIWTDIYLFGVKPNPQFPGLTCATPVYDENGELIGVLSVDFALGALSTFLGKLNIFETGIPFIFDEDQIVAHPDPAQMVGQTNRTDDDPTGDLLHIEDIPSLALRNFMESISTNTNTIPNGYDWTTQETRYIGIVQPLQSSNELKWSIAIMVPRQELMGKAEEHIQTIGIIAVVSLLTLIMVGVILARAIARPLRELTAEVEQIGKFHLDALPMPKTWLWEVQKLSIATEEMKTGLRSFGKYVPDDLVRHVLESGTEAKLGGEEKTLTIFFSDIANFTNLSEKLTPQELVDVLGEYLGAMTKEIGDTGGTVDKYIGDAIMAFWGAPQQDENHAANACDAALRNMDRLGLMQQEWRKTGKPEVGCRIGLNTGPLIVGNIGSKERLNYTVIGDAVNLASRLENMNKVYGTSILVSQHTADAAGSDFLVRPLEKVAVKGKTEGVLLYELIGWKATATDEQKQLVELAHQAYQSFQNREFIIAKGIYQQMLEIRVGDLGSQQSIIECTELIATPPAEDWLGIRKMTTK